MFVPICELLTIQDLDLTRLNSTIGELKIGTYENLISARHDTPLIEILRLFISKGISSVPIVDENKVVLNVYEKYDVLLLAREGPYYNLDIPVSDALLRRPFDFPGIHSCSVDDTLGEVLTAIRDSQVRRFIVLRDSKLQGILSLSDLLRHIIRT